MAKFRFIAFVLTLLAIATGPFEAKIFADQPAIPTRPVVPGTFRLHLRERKETAPKSGKFEVVERDVDWRVAQTVIIICDMWEDHPCQMSAFRVDAMAPDMNRVVATARSLGTQIVHSPSSGVPFYEASPQRQRVKAAPSVKPPVPIESWCYLDLQREAEYPIPYSTKVEDGCDDPVYLGDALTSRRQHAAIKIVGYDGLSDNGTEIFNFLEQLGIRNVVLMGVHTHYCVLGRSFGIRQMVKLGKNVVLCRDLTDAMYDPRKPPFVSHQRGTELAVEHIEKYWCPSITSSDLVTVVPGSADPVPAVKDK